MKRSAGERGGQQIRRETPFDRSSARQGPLAVAHLPCHPELVVGSQALREALPQRALTHQHCPDPLTQRSGEELRRGGGISIDEDHHGLPLERVAGKGGVPRHFTGLQGGGLDGAAGQRRYDAVGDEPVGDVGRGHHVSAPVASQIQQYPLDGCRSLGHECIEGVVGVWPEGLDASVEHGGIIIEGCVPAVVRPTPPAGHRGLGNRGPSHREGEGLPVSLYLDRHRAARLAG